MSRETRHALKRDREQRQRSAVLFVVGIFLAVIGLIVVLVVLT